MCYIYNENQLLKANIKNAIKIVFLIDKHKWMTNAFKITDTENTDYNNEGDNGLEYGEASKTKTEISSTTGKRRNIMMTIK